MKPKKYEFEVLVSDFNELKLKKFREIIRVVYRMLEISTLVECEISEEKPLKHKVPTRKSVYLWESMCAVYSTKKKVKGFTPKTLLENYINKQKSEEKLKYVSFIEANPERALKTAEIVLKLRRKIKLKNKRRVK